MPAHKLSPVQLFFVEHHLDSKTAEELALEVDAPVASVRTAIRKIKAERKKSADALARVVTPPEPAAPAPAVEKLYHQAQDGRTVSMTEAASAVGDEAAKRTPRGSQHPRYAACIGKIDPSKPSQ